jgi:hypothetical protein
MTLYATGGRNAEVTRLKFSDFDKRVLYGLLFRTSAETLREVARNPRHLGAEIGFFPLISGERPEF